LNEQPQTWHYGLIPRWWAEFNAPDLGCGAGRLLLPLLSVGLDIAGCDISPDMLAFCREGAAKQGLTASLYQQAMRDLELPQRYRTISM
jgi:2-polyprenyl-3-methyl-5-hydroxy-6-metoxy-1,4-benzoquinol methylase